MSDTRITVDQIEPIRQLCQMVWDDQRYKATIDPLIRGWICIALLRSLSHKHTGYTMPTKQFEQLMAVLEDYTDNLKDKKK